MIRGPLTQQFRIGARVCDLISRGPREVVGGDIADRVSAGLDRVHANIRQCVQDIRDVTQPGPVELDVLTGREVAEALVPALGDHRELAQLRRLERAVRDSHAQHICVELQIQAIHEPQRLELFLGQLAGDAALDLSAELGDPLAHECRVEIGIDVHRGLRQLAPACLPWG